MEKLQEEIHKLVDDGARLDENQANMVTAAPVCESVRQFANDGTTRWLIWD